MAVIKLLKELKQGETFKFPDDDTKYFVREHFVGFPFLVRFKIRQFFILYQNFILC